MEEVRRVTPQPRRLGPELVSQPPPPRWAAQRGDKSLVRISAEGMELRPIFRINSPWYWKLRAKERQWRFSLSLRASRIRDGVSAAGERWRISANLVKQSGLQALVALLGFVVIEVCATLASPIQVPVVHFFAQRVSPGTYADLLAAGVGVVGTLLGLYYATVGVVASTVYQAVPASVRTLFVQEPSGLVYVAGATRATVFGLAELALGASGVTPSRVALFVFTILGLNTLFRLAILGSQIFNFFDPSALASTLSGRITRAASRAAKAPGSLDAGTQAAAHSAASHSLSTYHDLAILLEDRKSRTASGPRRLTQQLIRTSIAYASIKAQIPTDSWWWGREPAHASWMTLDQMRLEMSLLSGTGVPPSLVPNRIWFEQAVSKVLDRTFASAYAAGGSAAVLVFADEIAQLTRFLGSHLQLREAFVLADTWCSSLKQVLLTSVEDEDSYTSSLNKLAAAEQLFFPIINSWLGFVDGAETVSSIDVVGLFSRGLADRRAIYNSRLPARTVELLEKLLEQGEAEVQAEGAVVSPTGGALT